MQRKVSTCHTRQSDVKDVRSARDEQILGWFMFTEPGRFNPPPSCSHRRRLEPAWARLTFLLGRSIGVGTLWLSLTQSATGTRSPRHVRSQSCLAQHERLDLQGGCLMPVKRHQA
jgi:hypothetical protein